MQRLLTSSTPIRIVLVLCICASISTWAQADPNARDPINDAGPVVPGGYFLSPTHTGYDIQPPGWPFNDTLSWLGGVTGTGDTPYDATYASKYNGTYLLKIHYDIVVKADPHGKWGLDPDHKNTVTLSGVKQKGDPGDAGPMADEVTAPVTDVNLSVPRKEGLHPALLGFDFSSKDGCNYRGPTPTTPGPLEGTIDITKKTGKITCSYSAYDKEEKRQSTLMYTTVIPPPKAASDDTDPPSPTGGR